MNVRKVTSVSVRPHGLLTPMVTRYGGTIPTTANSCQKTIASRLTRINEVEYQDCRDVPQVSCKDVPKRECAYVTKTKCERQAYEDCYDVTKQNCEIVHSKVPQTLNGQKRIRVCDHGNGHVYNSNAQPDFDYADQVELIDAGLRENNIQEDEEENTTDNIDSFDNFESGLVFSD